VEGGNAPPRSTSHTCPIVSIDKNKKSSTSKSKSILFDLEA